MLRVVHRSSGNDILITTLYFDRVRDDDADELAIPKADAMFVWFGPEGA